MEEQLDSLKDIIYDYLENNDLYYNDIQDFKKIIIENMEFIYSNLNYKLIDNNFLKLINFKLEYNFNEKCKNLFNKDYVQIPTEYIDLVNHVKYIAELPQPEQRTQEWFDMRKNMITASCAAQVIGENPYPNQGPDEFILDKLNLGPPFIDNRFVHHGKKYEEIATKIYENIYNIKVDEYGLVPHISRPRIPFIGASPDGIASHYDLENNFSDMVGRMLEIKCPLTRKIKTSGKVDGEICPHYYYCQVQQQLECCDLEYCDFWQCSLQEFYSKDELFEDETKINYKEEQDKQLNVPINCRMGYIIQLLPKNKITKFCLFDAKYIYPEDVNKTILEYDLWLLDEITNLHRKYPDLMKNYVFDRVLYWKLNVCHNVKIQRNRDWFKEKYPMYKELWERIILYRSNKKELNKFITNYNKNKKNKVVVEDNESKFIDTESDNEESVDDKPDKSKLFVDSDESV